MLGISSKALDVSHERRAAIAAARAIRINDAAKDAQQHVREDADEWDMVDVEDQEAVASAPVGLETGKSIPVAGSAEADTNEAETERIALAAGDDIGDNEASHHVMVQKRVSSQNSNNSSMNVSDSKNDSRGLSDVGEDTRPTHENSPLGAEVLARLKFLDEEDNDDGGVKL